MESGGLPSLAVAPGKCADVDVRTDEGEPVAKGYVAGSGALNGSVCAEGGVDMCESRSLAQVRAARLTAVSEKDQSSEDAPNAAKNYDRILDAITHSVMPRVSPHKRKSGFSGSPSQ